MQLYSLGLNLPGQWMLVAELLGSEAHRLNPGVATQKSIHDLPMILQQITGKVFRDQASRASQVPDASLSLASCWAAPLIGAQ
jgi:hypothetical protein